MKIDYYETLQDLESEKDVLLTKMVRLRKQGKKATPAYKMVRYTKDCISRAITALTNCVAAVPSDF